MPTEYATGINWTEHHSWYAIMNEFTFEISRAPTPFLADQREKFTLTPEGLVLLAEHRPHLLPHISDANIEDKT